jgi:hypothetical protein
MFAFLRRPASPEDVLPLLNPFEEDLGYRLRAYFPNEVRQIARDPDGERYFEIPGFERGFSVPPARCLPPSLRKHRAQLVAEQRKQEARLVYCIDELGPKRPAYPEASCSPFADIQNGAGLIATAESTTDVLELAPDGVATVRLHYRGGAIVAATVTDNVFDFTPPQRPIRKLNALQRKLERKFRHRVPQRRLRALVKRLVNARARLVPRTVEWLAANGEPLRVFHPPSGRQAGGLIVGIAGGSLGANLR